MDQVDPGFTFGKFVCNMIEINVDFCCDSHSRKKCCFFCHFEILYVLNYHIFKEYTNLYWFERLSPRRYNFIFITWHGTGPCSVIRQLNKLLWSIFFIHIYVKISEITIRLMWIDHVILETKCLHSMKNMISILKLIIHCILKLFD